MRKDLTSPYVLLFSFHCIYNIAFTGFCFDVIFVKPSPVWETALAILWLQEVA